MFSPSRSTSSALSEAHIVALSANAPIRREQGLPGDLSVAVFANFNKVDKLDPESFLLWMQVLRRVPRSVLWLLEASAVHTEVGCSLAQATT